jgi:hypothetical protein
MTRILKERYPHCETLYTGSCAPSSDDTKATCACGKSRNDLIFPILYITVAALANEASWRASPVLSIIARRQYFDWRPERHLEIQSTAARSKVEAFCRNIVDALNQPWISPEERQRIARQQGEEAEARRVAEEELRRRRAEAEARQRANRERAEAMRRADEEERRRKAEAEASERAEKERARIEEEAKRNRERAEAMRRADEEERREEREQDQAFAAAKRADSISAIDAFLTKYPAGRFANEARTLQAALVERDDAFKEAMTSYDAGKLTAFLNVYPKGPLADQVRSRLPPQIPPETPTHYSGSSPAGAPRHFSRIVFSEFGIGVFILVVLVVLGLAAIVTSH